MFSVTATDFHLPGQTGFYRGKVRDVYTVRDKYLVVVTTDRISAFDVVLPRAIPFKGAVLNQIAAHFLQATQDIVPNWVISVPHPCVTIGHVCRPMPIEMIVRGFLSGSAWRAYKSGRRSLCGAFLPEGLKENDPFPEPILTPTTKAGTGHDEETSKEEIMQRGIVSDEIYAKLEHVSRRLFARGSEMARKKGLLLVDTKYEFGMRNDAVFLMDEIHTPDSSRYFYAEGYEERRQSGQPQRQLSKEFVREWLMERGFQGNPGEKVPEMNDVFVESVSKRYMELYERLIRQPFPHMEEGHFLRQMEAQIIEAISPL